MLDLMKQCDFRMIFVGIETPDPALLRQTQKKQNTLRPIAESIRKINEAGMMVLAGFIIGFDEEKPGAGDALAACVEETNIAVAMTGLLVSLPNTQLERRLMREGRQMMRTNEEGVMDHEIDQMTGGLNFVTRRPRVEILKEYRAALLRIYAPDAYFARVRRFLDWYKGHPRPGDSAGSKLDLLKGLANLCFRYLVRPPLWRHYIKIMAAGLRHSAIGFARAGTMCTFFLHLQRQTAHVVKELDAQILELEAAGEESYIRKRKYATMETEKVGAAH